MQFVDEKPVEPTLIVCLDEHGKATGTLYEDAGDGWGYKKGDYSLTTYQAEKSGNSVVVKVAKSEGNRERPKRNVNVLVIAGGVPVRAVKIALAGFDTHANQTPTHEALLAVLAEGLATFRRNMIVAGRWDSVLVLTYSEFGRRAGQNASAGTDHGTAAPLFVLGGRVKGGLHGSHPSLADLEDGDLRHTVDFRDVYSAIAHGCWDQTVGFGQRTMQKLDLVAS